jgi:Zn-finger nucleic acid-binding protein
MEPRHDCPRCRLPLVQGRAGKITAQTCPRCGGVWLATEPAEQLKKALERGAAKVADDPAGLAESACLVAQDAARRVPFGAVVDTRRQGIPCALCRAPMSATRLAHAAIDIDTCPEHGTWFDRGELQHVVECSHDPRIREESRRRFGDGMATGVAVAGAGVVGAAAATTPTQWDASSTGVVADSVVDVVDVAAGGFSLLELIVDLFD